MELQRSRHKLLVLVLLPLLLLSNGCAVQRSKAPQIDAKTTYALNLESQVTQYNKDYMQFFQDVGIAQRAGQLTAANVTALNTIGSRTKVALEEADRLTKAYATSYDAGTAATIGSLLAQISSDLTLLVTTRSSMLGGVK